LLNESCRKIRFVSKQEIERQKIALNLANQRLALQQQMNALEEALQNKNKHQFSATIL
jgi:hypothetical protein